MTANSSPNPLSKWTAYRHLYILFGLFLVTLLIRSDSIKEPVKGSHVWLTAHTAMTMEIWEKEGIAKHHFSPVYTYNAPANKHLRSLASGLSDEDGNYYYVSYPPFSFLLAYGFIKTLRLAPSMQSLQLLNLVIHFATSLLVYIVLCRLYRQKVRDKMFPPALMGAGIYLFAMQALWCHGYMYFADTVVQVIWVASLLFAFEILYRDKATSWPHLFALGLAVFLACYTEWLGFFFAATLFIVSTIFAFKNRIFIRLGLITAVAASSALVLTIYQYAQINGLDSFLEASVNKYSDRSGYGSESFYYIRLHMHFIVRHYWRLYYPIIGAIFFLFVALATHKGPKVKSGGYERRTFFSLLIVPILLHHFLFLEFTKVHDFALLKTLLLFSFAVPILYQSNIDRAAPEMRKSYVQLTLLIITVLMSLNLLIYYKYDNSLPSDPFIVAGNHLKHDIDPEATVYAVNRNDRDSPLMIFMGSHRSFSPQVQLISQRNVLGVKDKSEALAHMQQNGFTKGHLIEINLYGVMLSSEPLRSASGE